MAKALLITQSNYIPWKGYFDSINRCDEVVLYDDMQYTRRDWRNRNKIKTPQGLRWLSIPVVTKGLYHQKIRETRVTDGDWANAHWAKIRECYAGSPAFKELSDWLSGLYEQAAGFEYLSEVNHHFLRAICDHLGIETPFFWSSEFDLAEDPTRRLVDICLAREATEYWTGPAARAYMDDALFEENGITVRWLDYSDYPEYPQLHPPFEHGVSILDLLLNCGDSATSMMKTFS